MTDDTLKLASEFQPSSEAQWRKLTDAALKGADFEKRLVKRTYDGLRVDPLYPRAKGAAPVAGRPARPWQVMARVDHPDPAAANKQALDDLENGATGLTLVFGGAVGAYSYGIDSTPETLARVLDGIYLEAPIELDLSPQHKDAGETLAALIKQRGVNAADATIRFGYDPLGAKARAGSTPLANAEIDKIFVEIVRGLSGNGFAGPFACADGRIVHAAGGSEAQELGFVVANAVHYLRLFADAGFKDPHRLIWFRLAADADEFMTIAKLRALRKLWARVLDASGLPNEPAFVASETAWRMMTRRDPAVNMLRTTIAIAAAGVGGADSMTALPHTMALGLPDAFARRVARNAQLVLIEEASLAKVADPAAGSGAIEALTGQIVHAAWTLLQDIEKAGGASAAIEQGLVQDKVVAARKAREAAVAKRLDPLTGTSEYPDIAEPAVDMKVLDVKRVEVPPLPAMKTFAALTPVRLAEPFEALRDKSDAILKATGARPKVFLANLGKISHFTARAMFARNFYEAGGIEAVTNDGFKSHDEMIAAFKASGAKLACICSSDKVYETEAADTAKALAAAGAIVHLAGRPGELEQALKDAGVKTFIFVGCDVLATLRATHDILR